METYSTTVRVRFTYGLDFPIDVEEFIDTVSTEAGIQAEVLLDEPSPVELPEHALVVSYQPDSLVYYHRHRAGHDNHCPTCAKSSSATNVNPFGTAY